MDAALLDQLELEHRQAEELFAKLEKADTEAEQRSLVDEIVAALTTHMNVEETEVYPEVQKLDAEMKQEAENEHELGRSGMFTLQKMVGEPGFGAAVAMLKAGISHHVEEEESEVFPKLRDKLGYPAADTSKRDLYEQAKAAGIEGRSTMTKDELIEAVQQP